MSTSVVKSTGSGNTAAPVVSADAASTTPVPRRGRGRRPAAEVRAEVLAAAAELLLEEGIAAVTFERAAAASGASKTTVYKWWPSPGALAAEAYFQHVEHDLEFADTGDIERDVRTQLIAFAHLVSEGPAGRAVRELIGAAQSDADLRAAFVFSYSRPRRQAAVDAFRLAAERGQIRAGVSAEVLVDQLWGACYHRLLLLDEPVDAELIDQIVTNAFHGAARSNEATRMASESHSGSSGTRPAAARELIGDERDGDG